jgi:energy-converting hydrogenase Eha subunit B
MGQFFNQPDFATSVDTVAAIPANNINQMAIYIGVAEADATITVTPVGNSSSVTFKGITGGSFLPVIVTSIDAATGILPADILLIK